MQQELPAKGKLTFNSVKDYVTKTRDLLRQQQQYQIEMFEEITKNKTIAEIQASGFGLSNMTIVGTKRGYYGKTVLSLTKAYHSQKNPLILSEQCKIQVGDDVALYKNNSMIADGVVSKRYGPKLQITTRKELEDDNDLQGINCSVIIKWNQVTFRRYFRVLGQLEQSQSQLIPSFFPPTFQQSRDQLRPIKQSYSNPKLNDKQNEAVQRCMQEQIFLLHGPPGTGKTTTVCEVIVQAVKRGYKILACGPSNISVDNIVQSLSGKVNCIRIGNPARIIDNVMQRCLDSQIAKNSGAWKSQVKKLQSSRKKLKRGGSKEQRRKLYNQIKQLKDEIYQMQQQVIKQILQDAQVLCCTNVGAADRIFNRYLSKQIFDLVVIDQCGQALQVSCWIPLLKGRRVLLAGDHKQLPPTIKGNDNSILSHTLFTRSMEELKHIPSIMLEVQYRMNNSIMGWSNEQFYHKKLRAHDSVQKHTLRQLCLGLKPDDESLMFIDTAGCGMGEQGGQNQSKMNIGQADLVIAIYKKLIDCGVLSKYIAVLTPYSKQVALIKSIIAQKQMPSVDVSTVDGIQGREKECIIISMVRSNSKRQIGFLKDWRRMNVAVTRARRMLILVGNVESISADKYIHALVNWVQEHGHVSSAEEWRGDDNVRFGLGASDKIQTYKKDKDKDDKDKDETVPKQKKKKNKGKEKHKQEHKEHTEQEQANVKAHFRKVLQQMPRELTINNATAFQRKMIHQIAQEMGICHQTSADKKYIKVWKKLTNDQVAEQYAEMQRIKMEEDLAEQIRMEKKRKKKQKQKLRKEKAKEPKITSNKFADQLKGLQESSEQQKIQQQKVEEKIEPKQQQTKKKKKKKQESQQEDIEALMKEYQADQPKEDECFKCSKKISTVTRVQCKFCFIYYCRMHVLAQEHGCGDIAKQDARKLKPSKQQLQKAAMKMQEQIKKQQEGRKKKGKEDKK